jgi:hypothetical protein
MYRTRAKAAIVANCRLLKELSNLFWNAEVMARMGERVLKEMDKAITSITNEQQVDGLQRVVSAGGNEVAVENLKHSTLARLGDAGEFDNSMFDQIPELDIFAHFDPSFDLDAVDAAFGDNLDVGMPLNSEIWDSLINQ